ncbi:DUF1080 domain-containing protein [Roseiconus lacunae]|uniref:3-keto-disaccharide hydrolase n=1 Tax=Roseiconus lacunae TaxID=2605694 RepID=UPI003093397C|nr:DUF1080 domain-containing protein [Stieleria sp. HD01]
MICRCFLAATALLASVAGAGELDPSQQKWIDKYEKQQNAPNPAEMLINTESEPALGEGFEPLFNGKNLDGWRPIGGECKFEAVDGEVIGTCVPGSPSTYLSSERDDYKNFIFTCEMKWEEDGNSGVMFRAKLRKKGDKETVYGPQAEMEGFSQDRGWSGGIYGQSCGGYFYPLWLKQHAEARQALKEGEWNRLTIKVQGNDVKTWINGVPAAHWQDDGTYAEGYFGLQIHSGKSGKVRWKGVRVKEL